MAEVDGGHGEVDAHAIVTKPLLTSNVHALACLKEDSKGRSEDTSPLYIGERTAWRSLPKAPITDMTKMIKIYI